MPTEFFEVDELGKIVEVYVYDEEKEGVEIPKNLVRGWGNKTLYTPVYDFSLNEWKEGENEEFILQTAKYRKNAELDEDCAVAITSGFESATTGHFYEFEIHDQSNFTQQMMIILSDETIKNVTWKTLDAGIVNHTVDEFKALIKESENHKRKQIGKLWTLKEQVMNATSMDEINNINWNTNVLP